MDNNYVLQDQESNTENGKVMNISVQVWDTNGHQRRVVQIYASDGMLCIDIDPDEIIAAP